MRILVTGATGFLGTEVLHGLLACDIEVTALVRPHGDSADRLGAAGRDPRVRLVAGDLADRKALADACDGADAATHLAAVVQADADEVEAVNVEGTRNVVEACVQTGVKRVVVTSSTAVYGFGHRRWDVPVHEDAPLASAATYGRSKAVAEQIARELAGDAGIECVVLRPELVYGARAARFQRLVARVAAHPVWTAAAGQGITLQPIHVRDAARAHILAATVPGIDRATFNLAGAEHLTHHELVRVIRRSLGPAHADEVWRPVGLPALKYDIRRARAELGFEPAVMIEDGIPQEITALRRDGSASPRALPRSPGGWGARRPVGIGGWSR